MKKFFLTFLVVLICSSVAVSIEGSETWYFKLIYLVATTIFGIALGSFIQLIDRHNQSVRTWAKSQLLYRKRDIYLSFSYLYRIEVGGKYLLIRGNRLKSQFQPVGGVYKFYEPGRAFLDSIGFLPGGGFVNCEESNDLRLLIKGKNLLLFCDWFLQMKDREYDPTREFYEELIGPGYIDKEAFGRIEYRKVGVHNKGITNSIVPERPPEVIYADIFEIILTDYQKNIIEDAVNRNSDNLYLATIEEIKSRTISGYVEMNISNNAMWIIGGE